MRVNVTAERWELRSPFRITRGTFHFAEVVVVEIENGAFRGRGEAAGVDYHGEDTAALIARIEAVAEQHGDDLDRDALMGLPPGGARNALDCALWDLESKSAARSIWELVGIEPRVLTTVCTIGIDTPEAMAAAAAELPRYPILKIKLNDDEPVARIRAIREARPDVRIVVDANQAWTLDRLSRVAPELDELGVEMIEQPLPEAGDEGLIDYESPIVLCADESCNTTEDLAYIQGRYEMVNIKLDKTGGLTEALRLANAARRQGLELMVGNMLGTSLAMAPAFVVGQLCRYNDLDGPLLQKEDRSHAMRYDGSAVSPPDPALWG